MLPPKNYQKTYTTQQLNELLQWFTERMDQLPQSLDLAPGIHISNLSATVKYYFDIVHEHYKNPTYSAQISHLFRMRERLLEIEAAKSDLP